MNSTSRGRVLRWSIARKRIIFIDLCVTIGHIFLFVVKFAFDSIFSFSYLLFEWFFFFFLLYFESDSGLMNGSKPPSMAPSPATSTTVNPPLSQNIDSNAKIKLYQRERPTSPKARSPRTKEDPLIKKLLDGDDSDEFEEARSPPMDSPVNFPWNAKSSKPVLLKI